MKQHSKQVANHGCIAGLARQHSRLIPVRCKHRWHWTSQHWLCPEWPTISDTCRKCNAHRTRKMTADEIDAFRVRWSICRRAKCPLTHPLCKSGAILRRKL